MLEWRQCNVNVKSKRAADDDYDYHLASNVWGPSSNGLVIAKIAGHGEGEGRRWIARDDGGGGR